MLILKEFLWPGCYANRPLGTKKKKVGIFDIDIIKRTSGIIFIFSSTSLNILNSVHFMVKQQFEVSEDRVLMARGDFGLSTELEWALQSLS